MTRLYQGETRMKPRFHVMLAVLALVHMAPGIAQDLNAGRSLAAACFTCHGTDGNSVQGIPPSLAGRSSAELVQAMKEFQSGKRPATVMHQQARGYDDRQLQLIAAYFASVKPAAPRQPPKP
jgi:cytochrome subunit of sulfide dehydrogenase